MKKSDSGIIVLGALYQRYDKDRVLSPEGNCATLRATDYKDPIKILQEVSMDKLVCEERRDEGLRTFTPGTIGTIRTIMAGGDKRVININADKDGYTIRRLTPRECWRLMGFTDADYDKARESGMSDTQLYKQAGNSIVVDTLYHIYKALYEAMPYLFEDLTISSYFSGIGAFEAGLDRLYADINNEGNTKDAL